MNQNNQKRVKFAYIPKVMLEELLAKSEAYDKVMSEQNQKQNEEPCCSFCGATAIETEDEILIANEDKTSFICLECAEEVTDGEVENNENCCKAPVEEAGSNCDICGAGCGGVKANEDEMPQELKDLVNQIRESGLGEVEVMRIPMGMPTDLKDLSSKAARAIDSRRMPGMPSMFEMPEELKAILSKGFKNPQEPKDIIAEIFNNMKAKGVDLGSGTFVKGTPLNINNAKGLEDILKDIIKSNSDARNAKKN
jgi:hypothetical protein